MTQQISEQDKLELAAIAPMLSEAEKKALGVPNSLEGGGAKSVAKREPAIRGLQSRDGQVKVIELIVAVCLAPFVLGVLLVAVSGLWKALGLD